MKKTDDPYLGLANMMVKTSKQNGLQQGCVFGEIVTPPPDIKILYNGMTLDSTYFYLDEYCLPGHYREVRGHIVSATQNRSGGSGDAAYESHNHDIDNDYTATLITTDTWHIGDKVAMLPIYSSDDMQSAQQFLILARIIRLDGVII